MYKALADDMTHHCFRSCCPPSRGINPRSLGQSSDILKGFVIASSIPAVSACCICSMRAFALTARIGSLLFRCLDEEVTSEEEVTGDGGGFVDCSCGVGGGVRRPWAS